MWISLQCPGYLLELMIHYAKSLTIPIFISFGRFRQPQAEDQFFLYFMFFLREVGKIKGNPGSCVETQLSQVVD